MPNSTCLIPDDSHTGGRLTRGMCAKHYQRWRKDQSRAPMVRYLACPVCGDEFTAKSAARIYCSRRCVDKGKPSSSGLTCSVCGEPMHRGHESALQGVARHRRCATTSGFGTGHNKGCKCETCREVIQAKSRAYRDNYRALHGVNPSSAYRKRAREAGRIVDYYRGISANMRTQVYERDELVCQICFTATDPLADSNSGSYPSVDHIVPFSQGGSGRLDNLRTAHRRCNSLRADGRLTDEEVRSLATL